MIRPEARQTLLRYSEALIALPILAAGLWGLSRYGLLIWIGGALTLLGAALLLTGLQRARFRRPVKGPGLVEMDEHQIRYLGPLTGGAVDLDTLVLITLDPTGKPLHWRLTTALGETLAIPATATGTDALFDAFTTLPGFRTEPMLRALAHPPARPLTIWRNPKAAVDTARFSPQA